MQVVFYLTRVDGQEVAATITLDDAGQLQVTGSAGYLDLLFDAGQREAGPEAMAQAMRDAPSRFDGSYLRAEFQE